jgi:hypothetical protein
MTDPTGDLTPDLRRRLRILADTLPMLESPDVEPGRWHDSEKQDGKVVRVDREPAQHCAEHRGLRFPELPGLQWFAALTIAVDLV